jgi:DNA mismatch repair protein MutL
MDVSIGDEQTLLKQVLQQYQEFGQRLRLPARERLAMAFAFRTAVAKGKKMSPQEMESLFDQLFACSEPFIDPAGNTTIIYVSLEELTRPFR